jgi:hypothetical protein
MLIFNPGVGLCSVLRRPPVVEPIAFPSLRAGFLACVRAQIVFAFRRAAPPTELFAVVQTGSCPMSSQKRTGIGSGGVGESAVTIQLVQGSFVVVYDPTVEDSCKKAITVNGTEVSVNILDTTGQDDFKTLRQTYIVSSSSPH